MVDPGLAACHARAGTFGPKQDIEESIAMEMGELPPAMDESHSSISMRATVDTQKPLNLVFNRVHRLEAPGIADRRPSEQSGVKQLRGKGHLREPIESIDRRVEAPSFESSQGRPEFHGAG